VILAICAAIGFVAWLIWELTERRPIVDLSLFKRRNFALGTIAYSLGYALFFANILLMPLWLQQQLGYTATWAGFVAAPSGLVAIALTPLVARYNEKIDARWIATIAFIGFAVCYFLRAGLTAQTDVWHIVVPALAMGVSMSTFFLAILTILLDKIPPEQIGSASGIATFVRTIGAAFAASIVTTIWDRREALHQSHLSDVVTMPAGQGAGLGLNELQAAASVSRQMVGQAYLLASVDIFWVSAWLALAMIALVWLSRKPAAHAGPIAAD